MPQVITDLVDALYELLKRKKKVMRLRSFNLFGLEVQVWKYYDSYFLLNPPILARPFYTYKHQNSYYLMSRGYDKFTDYFKIKDSDQLDFDNVELTVKENGCLIIVTAIKLKDMDHLVIGSKTVLALEENSSKHSKHAEILLNKHLTLSKKTKSQLINFITQNNVTLLFEMCDDSFEEHIVSYLGREGLYLHGIVENTIDFKNWRYSELEKVASEFGFHITQCEKLNSLDSIKEKVQKTVENNGIYNGRLIEGFVARLNTKSNRDDNTFNYMVKFKLNKPYLMYREWREITNEYIALKNIKTKIKFDETYKYLSWLKKDLEKNPHHYSEYLEKKNIVANRERYLEYLNTNT